MMYTVTKLWFLKLGVLVNDTCLSRMIVLET